MARFPIVLAYRSAIWTAIAVQLVLGLFLLTILDGGRTAAAGACAIAAFWLGAVVIIARRPEAPAKADLLLLRWGSLPLLVAAITIAQAN